MIKHIIAASRPKTLAAAFIPPFVAHGLYTHQTGESSPLYLALCVVAALLIQLATNFYNDAVDAIKGADLERVGPKRVSSSGDVSPKTAMMWGHIAILLAAIVGAFLFMRGGPVILVFGVLSLYLSYGYTGGPFPLAYIGLGELFVFLFFGLFAVAGSYYIYALELTWEVFVLAAQVGLLSTSLIMINNLRDRHSDKKVGKRTLATRVKVDVYLNGIYACLVLPYFLQLFFADNVRSFMVIFAIPALLRVHSVIKENREGAILNEALKFAGIHLLVFGILDFVGFAL